MRETSPEHDETCWRCIVEELERTGEAVLARTIRAAPTAPTGEPTPASVQHLSRADQVIIDVAEKTCAAQDRCRAVD
jgi:hypothetical protein